MNMRVSISGTLFTLALCSGCVMTSAVRDEPRAGVRFASAEAASVFYDAYIAQTYTRVSGKGRELSIYVSSPPLPYHHIEYPTDNVLFNAAVAAADTNHDGTISMEEANAFSIKVKASSPIKETDSGHIMVAKK